MFGESFFCDVYLVGMVLGRVVVKCLSKKEVNDKGSL